MALLMLALSWTAVATFGGHSGTDLVTVLVTAATDGLAFLLAVVLLRLQELRVRVTRR